MRRLLIMCCVMMLSSGLARANDMQQRIAAVLEGDPVLGVAGSNMRLDRVLMMLHMGGVEVEAWGLPGARVSLAATEARPVSAILADMVGQLGEGSPGGIEVYARAKNSLVLVPRAKMETSDPFALLLGLNALHIDPATRSVSIRPGDATTVVVGTEAQTISLPARQPVEVAAQWLDGPATIAEAAQLVLRIGGTEYPVAVMPPAVAAGVVEIGVSDVPLETLLDQVSGATGIVCRIASAPSRRITMTATAPAGEVQRRLMAETGWANRYLPSGEMVWGTHTDLAGEAWEKLAAGQ